MKHLFSLSLGICFTLLAPMARAVSEPQVFLVTTLADSGAGSLRQAVADASNRAGPDFVLFDQSLNGGTIQLASTLVIDSDVTISALGLANGIVITDTGDTTYSLINSTAESVVLRNLTLTNGGGASATSLAGAGIMVSAGAISLENCTISDCTGSGGNAIFNASGTVSLSRCTLSGNATLGAGGGGAIYNQATLILASCTITGNAGGSGGAIYNTGGVDATHCTIANNTGVSCGGIYHQSSNTPSYLWLTNCIVADNSTPSGPSSGDDIFNYGGTITLYGVSILPNVENRTNGTEPATIVGPGSRLTSAPLLKPLGNYGGPTKTMPPLGDSPALDAASVVGGFTDDQRGLSIPSAGGPDIGAVEVQVSVVTTKEDQDDMSDPAISLREALANNVDLIRFDPTVFTGGAANVISLSDQIIVTDSDGVTVDGSMIASGITIDGGASGHRLFQVNSSAKYVTLRCLTLMNGRDPGTGGAINNVGNLTLERCTLTGNQAPLGGAIFNFGSLVLIQCTLAGNSSPGVGVAAGAILNGGILTLNHCTLTNNSSSGAGGAILAATGTLNLSNSIVSGNSSGTVGNDIYLDSGTINATGVNFIGSILASGLTANGTTILDGDANLNPAGLASNGGPTKTIALLASSPAINASASSIVTSDQRGCPIVGAADLGACEVCATSPSPANAATVLFAKPDLSWTGATGATFAIYLGSSSGNLTRLGTSSTSSFTLPEHLSVGTHYWRVDATVNGTTFTGPEFSFIVDGVASTADSGAGSLRERFAVAVSNPGPDVIVLDPSLDGMTLTLNSKLFISDGSGDVTLDATSLPHGFTITDTGDVNDRLLHVSSGSSLIVRGVTFLNGGGLSFVDLGGAVMNEGAAVFTDCTFSGNIAQYQGGAIATNGFAATILTNCTLVSNSSLVGGGAIFNSGNSTLWMNNCTLANNDGVPFGDALLNWGTASMTHCTLAGSIHSIALIYMDSAIAKLTLINSIVAGDPGPGTGLDIRSDGGQLTVIGTNIARRLNVTSSNQSAGSFLDLDPMLQPLGNYGGLTQTMPPLPGSPAIDQASELSQPIDIDQRGRARPLGVRSDIGAVEGSVVIVNTAVDELDAPGSPGNGVSLREAVRDVDANGMIVFDRAVFTGATATTNTIILTQGPLNPQRNCTLSGSANPGGITIQQEPSFIAQPQPLSVARNTAVNFGVSVTNRSGGLTFQWRRNSVPLAGKTSASLNIANAQESDEGVYDVVLGEAPASTLTLDGVVLSPFARASQPASLVVDTAPVVIMRRTANAVIALGASHTLSVVAIGPPTLPLTYQWMKNGATVAGATKSSYIITNAQLKNAGAYTCVVTSGLTSVTSPTTQIAVVDTTPKTLHLALGAKFSPALSAAGNGLTYAWRRDSTDLSQTSASFTIAALTAANEGTYRCIVTGPADTVTGLTSTITDGFNTKLNVIIAKPQLVTPLTPPNAIIGQTYFYQLPQVVAANQATASFSVTGTLPPGLSLDSVTGIVRGRPTATKSSGYAVTFKATNLKGSDSASATINVLGMPAGSVGTFAGPAARSPLNDNLGGRLDLTTTSTGTFSGSVTLGARPKISFTNQLLLSQGAGDVVLRGNLTGIAMADGTALGAYIEVFAIDQRATLTLVHPDGTTLVIPAWINPWTTTNNATAYAATYTARLDPGTDVSTPNGFGFTSFTIAPTGSLTLAGKLPDNTALTGGSFMCKNGEVPVFQLLYANKGSLVGKFVIASNTALTGTMTWMKPAQAVTSTDTIYKDGFGPLTVTAAGGPYVAPLPGKCVMGAVPPVLPATTNSTVTFGLGGLTASFTQKVLIKNPSPTGLTNVATIGTPVQNSTAIPLLTASTGAFSGSFTLAGTTAALNRNAPFSGQIVTILGVTKGYGFFLLPSAGSNTATTPKLSGRVQFTVP